MTRIGIFLFRNEYGIVHGYVEYLLNDIVNNLDELYVVVNGALSKEGKERFEKFTNNIIIRPDIGFDVGGWQDVILNYCGFKKILKYDELILFNDSFFGPLYPFKKVFDKMDCEDVDFWGLSSHGAAPGMGNCPYGDRPRYLQTYFLAFRKSIVDTWQFMNYWRELPIFKKFEEVGEGFGCVFTKYFEDLGYKWKAYSDTSDLEANDIRKNMSFHTFNPYDMVVNRQFPIIKRKAFNTAKDIVLRYNYGDELKKLLIYIKNHTEYDLNLIYEYLLAEYNIYDLKNNLNLNYILASDIKKPNDNYKSKKIAVIAHLYYTEMFDYCFGYLKNIPDYIDIYITIGNEEKRKILEEKIQREFKRPVYVRKVQERGRDLAALLVGCNDILMSYEYLCFVHDKKSIQKEYITVGSSFCDLLWENMLGSEEYICNILDVLEDNPQVGLLVPPNVYHGTYFSSSVDYWTICYEKTKELADSLRLNANIEKNKPPVSVGTVFWCKSQALKNLFEFPFEYNDFPSEPLPGDGSMSHALERILPYVAQHHGFFTVTVMNSQYAEAEITNFRFMHADMQKTLVGMPNLKFNTHKVLIDSIISAKREYTLLKTNKKIVYVPTEVSVPVKTINQNLNVSALAKEAKTDEQIGLKGALINYLQKKRYPKFIIKVIRKIVNY